MIDTAINFAKVNVSTGYDESATSVVLVSGHGVKLPAVPFNVVWHDLTYPDPSDDPNVEIVRVTDIATDTITITRAQESTAAAAHNVAGHTYRMVAGLTAKVINTDLPATLLSIVNPNSPNSYLQWQSDGTLKLFINGVEAQHWN